MSSSFRLVQFITIKRQPMRLTKGHYGHWWFEIGDPNDPNSESFGWWPAYPPDLSDTLGGIKGELNGQTNFQGTLTQDPWHGEPAAEVFHPYVAASDLRTDDQIADCLRNFARSFAGEWRWEFGLGTNCHTFQEDAMAHCKLKKRTPKKSWI